MGLTAMRKILYQIGKGRKRFFNALVLHGVLTGGNRQIILRIFSGAFGARINGRGWAAPAAYKSITGLTAFYDFYLLLRQSRQHIRQTVKMVVNDVDLACL
jgi:hypothetical protein